MKNKTFLTLFLFCLFSLSGYAQKDNKEILENLKYYLEENDSLRLLCSDISNLKRLWLNESNPEKSDSATLKLYRRFTDNSVGYELYALTYHESPMVKMFAYCALHESNKVLLMETIRRNIEDTATIYYPYGGYYEELFEDRISVIFLTLEMTYWGYTDNLSITLNEKDIKFIRKEYERRIKEYAEKFEPYEITLEGRLLKIKFGSIIQPNEDKHIMLGGNMYYLDKKDWESDDYGKRIQVTGTVTVSHWFRKWREPEYGYFFMLAGPSYLIKRIEVKSVKILED